MLQRLVQDSAHSIVRDANNLFREWGCVWIANKLGIVYIYMRDCIQVKA